MADIRQTVKYAEYLKEIGWKVERAGKNYFFIKSAPLIGSVIKIQRPEEIDIEAIDFVRKKHRAFQVIVEPKSAEHETLLAEHGFKLSKSPYLPSKTLHLDLTKSIHVLYANLKKDTRYSLRKTTAVNIYQVEKLWAFRNAWRLSTNIRRWVPSLQDLDALKKSFGEKALFLITAGGESGAIFLGADEITYYWQAFSNKAGRRGLYQYKILWSGINWGKQRGAKIFDFEGIYDKRFPNKSWGGFTHFKKAFGGFEVEYPGAYVKYLLPFK